MYLAFKEKMNSLQKSDFEKGRLFDRLQVYTVAMFWVLFTAFLLYVGHEKEHGQKRYVSDPKISTVQREARTFELNSMKR